MLAAGFRRCSRPAGNAAAILLMCSPGLQATARLPVGQETPAAVVADSERDFDRLDASAGLRSGGAFPFDYQHLVFFPVDAEGTPSAIADLWTAASVQAGRLRAVFDDGWNYSLDMTVALFDADTLVARSQTRIS
ncbi:MAG: hypothetical protein ACE5FP_07620, partial [Gemmatimonadota bacterium]